jgi:hypothetical protein
MIRYRKGNPVRNLVGLAFLAVGLALLWAEAATISAASAEVVVTEGLTPSIGPAHGSVDALDLRI